MPVEIRQMDSTMASLVEVWKVLEALVVSMDRIGTFWRECGEDRASSEILQYMGPSMCKRLVKARRAVENIIEESDPSMEEYLEKLSESEIEFWQYPTGGNGSQSV